MRDMTKVLFYTSFAIALSSLLLAFGCSRKPPEQILGKWSSDGEIVVEYFENGTLTMTDTLSGDTAGSNAATGTWRILNDGRLMRTFNYNNSTWSDAIIVKFPHADVMEITDEDGEMILQTRIQ